MHYKARIRRDVEGRWLVEFPDCQGCQTFGDTRAEAEAMAADALEGWLEAHLEGGRVPPRPKAARGVPVIVPPTLANSIGLRWIREERGLTQAQAARLAWVSQQQIAKLQHPGANPTVEILVKVTKALGASVTVTIERAVRP